MDIALVYASRRGSTAEIAEDIAATLERGGHTVFLENVTSPAAVDQCRRAAGVVLGSAVYLEEWMPDMQHFVRDNPEVLVDKKLAIFSVGITGDEPELPADFDAEVVALFKGKLEDNGEWEPAMAGDHRDWSAIKDFAREVREKFDA